MADLRLLFDARAFEALEKISHDAQGATDALLLVAEYVQSGTPLPNDLSRWLCGAIEKSMRQPKAKRGATLLLELGFTRHHRRKAVASPYAAGQAFDALLDQGESQNNAASQVAIDFNISESTAVRIWKEYQEASRLHDEALRDEGLSDYDPWYD
jgi:hypothetical protein